VLLFVAAGLGQWGWSRAQLCRGAEDRLAGVWDAASRDTGKAAFLASSVPFAAGAWTGVERGLDRYTGEWARMHRAACEATRVRGEQSEELLDRRMACLDQRLGEARALAALFSRADAGVVEKSANAVNQLTPVGVCADTALLSASVPLPADAGRRSRIERLQARLAEVKALTNAGRDREALARLRPVLPAVKTAGHLPLQADARFLSGVIQDRLGNVKEAEAEVFGALLDAQAGGRPDLVAEAAGQLSLIGVRQNRLEDSERWLQLSRASISRLEGNGETAALLNNRLATLLTSQGRYEEAAATFQRAETLAERELGRDNLLSSKALNNRAAILDAMGRAKEALPLALRANAIQRKLLEPDHPDLSRSYTGLGNIYSTLGRSEDAAAMHRKALEIAAARYGEHHNLVAGSCGNLGNALFDLGRYGEALRYYQRGFAVLEVLSPESREAASMLINIGNALNELERPREALPLHQRAVALQDKLLPPDHHERAFGFQSLGETLYGLGQVRESLALLERARTILENAPMSPHLLAMNRFSQAQVRWDLGQKERALSEARAAQEVFAGAGLKSLQDEVEVWLRDHGQGGAGG
ncbi:MAG TPA: tetratricopeptide repeat protein, partial [Thermoanaerobaculia bacterium]|nr:tetratricopeptide repeat protein [Thermoanaerobaculia bacterium]